MENIIKALSTNFDLLDFFYVQYKIQNKNEQNYFFNAEHLRKKDYINFDDINLNLDKYDWETLCYNYNPPFIEELIDSHYNELNWYALSKNPNLVWNQRLFNKYWDNILVNSIISESQMFWDEKLVRFIISKCEKDSTKIFWLEKLSVITNIKWNLKMILDFPTSYWIREVINSNTIELSFEVLKQHKNLLNCDIFIYLQISSNLLWTIDEIEEFRELINFKILSKSKNVDWSNDIITTYEMLLDFKELSKNKFIPFDESIILKYENRWEFDSLSSNSNVKWNIELIKTIIEKINLNKVLQFNIIIGIDENFIHEYRDYIDWGTGCGNYCYTPAPIASLKNIPISVQTLIEKSTNWEVEYCKPYWEEKGHYAGEWRQFSSNEFITHLHLETFAEKLSWDLISENENILLTNEILSKFSDKWNWPKLINRNDFKVEHFYVIHQYLNFDLLSKFSSKIFEILELEKSIIYTYIKDNVEIAGDFRQSLRKPNYQYHSDLQKESKQKLKQKREFLTKQTEYANLEYSRISKYDERYDINAQERVYYDKIHYWLRKYFNIFEEISYLSDSFERERGYTPEKEIQLFFILYCESEEDFKKNYFDIYKNDKL